MLTDDGFGSFSDIVRGTDVFVRFLLTGQGVNKVIDDKQASPATPMVICLSLGGGFSSLMNSAVTAAKNAGIVVVVASGNNDADACNFSPSSSADAVTVSATSINDNYADFSNFGSCTTITAPGVGTFLALNVQLLTITGIRSSVASADNAFAVFSGTSMAAPHVAGAIALILSEEPTLTQDQIIADQRLFGPHIIPPISKGVFSVPGLFLDTERGPSPCTLATTTTESPVINPGSATSATPAFGLLLCLLLVLVLLG